MVLKADADKLLKRLRGTTDTRERLKIMRRLAAIRKTQRRYAISKVRDNA